MVTMIDIKPCPLCGKHPYMDGDDTLYPTGGWKLIKDDDCSYPVYLSCWDVHVMKREYPDRYGIDFGNVYTMHCPEVYGGCGMKISGNSKEEAIEKWNRRS